MRRQTSLKALSRACYSLIINLPKDQTSMTAKTAVTIIGLGDMGTALAEAALSKHYEVSVWNRSPGKTKGLEDGGAEVATRARLAGRGTGGRVGAEVRGRGTKGLRD